MVIVTVLAPNRQEELPYQIGHEQIKARIMKWDRTGTVEPLHMEANKFFDWCPKSLKRAFAIYCSKVWLKHM